MAGQAVLAATVGLAALLAALLVALLAALLVACGAPDAPVAQQPVLPLLREVTAERMGLRCALARMYLHDDYSAAQDPLAKVVFASPDGNRLALLTMPGARVFDFENGTEHLLGARPFMWSEDSRTLYLLGPGKFFSYSDGKLSPEPWLDAAFRHAVSPQSQVQYTDFISAAQGLIAVLRDQSMVEVHNVATRRSFNIWVGARWDMRRPVVQLAVGWNADRREPAVFVAHQDFGGAADDNTGPVHAIKVKHRVDVFSAHGERDFSAETTAGEVAFLPLLRNARVPLLAREKRFRCLGSIDAQGVVTSHPGCDEDIDAAYVDRTGRLMATRRFSQIWPRSLPLPGADASAPQYIATLPGGASLYLARSIAATADEMWRVAERNEVTARTPVAAGDCPEVEAYPRGEELSARTADGLPAHGMLFRPRGDGKARGLVVSLHGGPYAAAYDRLVRPFDTKLLDYGYAMADVDYRGSPGHGRALLERSYGGDWHGMIEDAVAIRSAALDELALPPDTPTILHGASYGGFIAIKAALEARPEFRSYVLEHATCFLANDAANISHFRDRTQKLSAVNDPDRALHALRIASRADGKPLDRDICARRLPDGTRIVIIHAKDDPFSPFANIQQFIDAQDRERIELFQMIGDGGGHNVMTAMSVAPQFTQVMDALIAFSETGVEPGTN